MEEGDSTTTSPGLGSGILWFGLCNSSGLILWDWLWLPNSTDGLSVGSTRSSGTIVSDRMFRPFEFSRMVFSLNFQLHRFLETSRVLITTLTVWSGTILGGWDLRASAQHALSRFYGN